MSGLNGQGLNQIMDATCQPLPQRAVETGTCTGTTTRLLAELFDMVVTIEASRSLYSKAQASLAELPNVTCLHGRSEGLLPALAAKGSPPTLYFLDAHTWAPKYGGPPDTANGFPLWDELAVLRDSPNARVVVVDDVHAFGLKGPPEAAGWADTSQGRIVEALGDRVERHLHLGDQLVLWLSPLGAEPRPVRFSLVVPSKGRPTLLEMLNGLGEAGLQAQDEVLVVVDGFAEVERVEKLVEASRLPCLAIVVGTKASRCWGNSQRNRGMAMATGTHILYMDDDDLPVPDAYTVVRRVAEAHPGHPLVFQMLSPAGALLPGKPLLRYGNVGTPCFVPPNDQYCLAPWTQRYEGDWDHIHGTCSLLYQRHGVRPVFVQQVVATCRKVD